MFETGFDPYTELVRHRQQIALHEDTIDRLIKHINKQEKLLADLAANNAHLAELHLRNSKLLDTLEKRLHDIE